MILATRLALFLGVTVGLSAQTLSFGEITLNTPVTVPPSYTVNVILTSGGTAAGVQFDLNFPTNLTVTAAAGAAATAASAMVNTAPLPQPNNPFCVSAPTASTCPSAPPQQSPNATNGLRVIIVGASLSAQTVTNNLIADGVVATLNVVPAAAITPTNAILSMPKIYVGATTAGNNTTAAASIPLTIIGPGDGSGNGQINFYNTYQVGDSYPFTADTIPNFGNGVDVNDAIQVLFAVDSVTGYSKPAACSDRFDAMDSFPQDTATVRGGNATIDVNDAIVTLFRVDSVAGYSTHPVRPSLNGVCISGSGVTGKLATPNRQLPPPTGGTLTLGIPAPAGNGMSRIPVYLRAGRDLPHLAFTFGLGDLQSPLQFQATAGIAPTVNENGVRGVIVAAWLSGIDVRSGQEVLLGHVIAPTSAVPNLKVFGTSAAGLDDHQLVGLEISGAQVVQQ